MAWFLLALFTVAPILVAIYLGRKLHRARVSAAC